MCQADSTILIPILAALISGLVVHRLTKNRDIEGRNAILSKEADIRRRHFRKFLYVFRGRMERIDHTDDAAVWKEYVRLAPEFKGEAALVGGDYLDSSAFLKLADTVGGWPYEQTAQRAKQEASNMRQVICDSIDRLIEFTNK